MPDTDNEKSNEDTPDGSLIPHFSVLDNKWRENKVITPHRQRDMPTSPELTHIFCKNGRLKLSIRLIPSILADPKAISVYPEKSA